MTKTPNKKVPKPDLEVSILMKTSYVEIILFCITYVVLSCLIVLYLVLIIGI